MDKKEFRVLIKHCFLTGKNSVETVNWLLKHYANAPAKSTIYKWHSHFKQGHTTTDDAERSGRPKTSLVPESIKRVHKLILQDRKLKLREVSAIVKISGGSVHTILHENLCLTKLFSKWVPRVLTVDQKQQRVDDSERCLELFQADKADFMDRYVTMDETWIHYYNPSDEVEKVGEGKSRAKQESSYRSAGKVLASVFWDARGILFIDFVEKGEAFNAEYYMSLLDRVSVEIGRKRPDMQDKRVLFHQDNAPFRKSMKTMVKLNALGFELLPHQPYSPDLSPSDYWLFATFKRMLRAKTFGSTEEAIAETEAFFGSKSASFFQKGIEMLEERWKACVECEGSYHEKLTTPVHEGARIKKRPYVHDS